LVLADRLPLGIGPGKIRFGDDTSQGYERHQFAEAFTRYLAEGASKPEQWNKRDEIRTSEPFQSGTLDLDVPVAKSQKPNNDGLCSSVPVQKRGNGNAMGVCELCGGSERAGEPLQSAWIDGAEHLFHRRCGDDWLAALDPEGVKQ
jgi:hypothetical protein